MEVYFVRHGETEWNIQKRFQGRSNSPLTENGLKQAKLLAKKLKNIHFNKIYSSNLKRAIFTAECINEGRNLSVICMDEFAEIGMGKVEGISNEEFQNLYPDEYKKFYANDIDYDPSIYGGETFEETEKRILKGLKRILNENKDDSRIIVVSHGAVLKILFHIFKNEPRLTLCEEPIPKNTSYTIVHFIDGQAKIVDFSNTDHLK